MTLLARYESNFRLYVEHSNSLKYFFMTLLAKSESYFRLYVEDFQIRTYLA